MPKIFSCGYCNGFYNNLFVEHIYVSNVTVTLAIGDELLLTK